MRLIVRFSLNDDDKSTFRNALARVLEEHGLKQFGRTATYEADAIRLQDLCTAMAAFWSEVAKCPKSVGVDHVWTYTDSREQVTNAGPSQAADPPH